MKTNRVIEVINALNNAGQLIYFDYVVGEEALRANLSKAISSAGGRRRIVVPKATESEWLDVLLFALAKLPAKYRNERIIESVCVVTTDSTNRAMKSLLLVALDSGRAHYFLCSMSKVPSLAGRCHDFFYHPPGSLAGRVVTSPSVRTQQLNLAAETAARGPSAAPVGGAVGGPPAFGPGHVPAAYDV